MVIRIGHQFQLLGFPAGETLVGVMDVELLLVFTGVLRLDDFHAMLLQGQGHGKGSPFPHPAFHADASPMQLGDAFHQGQSDACPGRTVAHLVEPVEDQPQLVGRDSLAGVRHRKPDLIPVGSEVDHDAVLGRRMLESVAEEVEQHPFRQVHIGLHHQRFRSLIAQVASLESQHPLLHGQRQVEAGHSQGHLSVLDLPEIQDAVHQPEENIDRSGTAASGTRG